MYSQIVTMDMYPAITQQNICRDKHKKKKKKKKCANNNCSRRLLVFVFFFFIYLFIYIFFLFLFIFSFFFSGKIMLDNSCESSARQTISCESSAEMSLFFSKMIVVCYNLWRMLYALYANNVDMDQTAHARNLVRASAVHTLIV